MASEINGGKLMDDEAITAFRQIAYAYLRAHYDSKTIPQNMREQIPAGYTYEGFTDSAIGRQITQMLLINSAWFSSFDPKTALLIGDPLDIKRLSVLFNILSEMFIEAFHSDEESYSSE